VSATLHLSGTVSAPKWILVYLRTALQHKSSRSVFESILVVHTNRLIRPYKCTNALHFVQIQYIHRWRTNSMIEPTFMLRYIQDTVDRISIACIFQKWNFLQGSSNPPSIVWNKHILNLFVLLILFLFLYVYCCYCVYCTLTLSPIKSRNLLFYWMFY